MGLVLTHNGTRQGEMAEPKVPTTLPQKSLIEAWYNEGEAIKSFMDKDTWKLDLASDAFCFWCHSHLAKWANLWLRIGGVGIGNSF